MALSIGGTASLYASSGTSGSTGTLTASSGSVIVVAVTLNSGGQSVSSCSCTNVTFVGTARAKSGASGDIIEEWTGVSTSAVSAAVTVNISGTTSFLTIHAYEVIGSPTTSYFDSGGSSNVPQTTNGDVDITITTNNAIDILLGAFRSASVANPVAGTNFTRILGATGSGYTMTEYRVVSSAGSQTVQKGVGNSTNGGIADAIIEAAAAAGRNPGGWVSA